MVIEGVGRNVGKNQYRQSNKLSTKKGPSIMAELIAVHRFMESQRPEGERICYDPYAVHFISPQMMRTLEETARDPARAKAVSEHYERLFPGLTYSIRARVRYFDDFVKDSVDEGLEQLVILGAGYDTRAYRIPGLENAIVFELDHPSTQSAKIEKIKEIFGRLPDHVRYVPVDLATEDLGQSLLAKGYDRSRKTLFLMEGLVMYLSLEAVDGMLAFIVENSDTGSAVLFDYFQGSVIDGTCEAGRNIRDYVKQVGEPLLFGIGEGMAEKFLVNRGFSKAASVTSEDYKKAYFHGVNEGKTVCNLMAFAYAVVE